MQNGQLLHSAVYQGISGSTPGGGIFYRYPERGHDQLLHSPAQKLVALKAGLFTCPDDGVVGDDAFALPRVLHNNCHRRRH